MRRHLLEAEGKPHVTRELFLALPRTRKCHLEMKREDTGWQRPVLPAHACAQEGTEGPTLYILSHCGSCTKQTFQLRDRTLMGGPSPGP